MKESLPLYEITLDLPAISQGFGVISVDEVLENLSDGRCFSKWAEQLARILYGLNARHPNDASDAFKNKPVGRQVVFEVKTLTENGVCWLQSKTQGTGRQGTKADFLKSLELHDYYIVADATELPVVRFIPVETSLLRYCYNKKCIGWRSASKEAVYVNFVDWGNKKFHKPCFKRSA